MSGCPDATVIAMFVDRQLPALPASDVERHLDSCVTCRQVVSGLARAETVAGGERYVIQRELARGGMGVISVAEDTLLHRTVAIKELITQDPALAARFERELTLTARLQHPAIVSIHDAGTWANGEPFYVMRLVTGQPLDRLIAATPSVAERLGLLPYAIAMIDALAYAHSHGILHRDLKPANVLVGDFGETVVIDWGLAIDMKRGGEREGVAGTPAYMAPEQARGDAIDERADVYALGAVLYHVLGGAPPYRGSSVEEILEQVTTAPAPPLADVPADLATIVAKAMARAATDRYANAGELAADLKRFQTGQLVGAHHYTRWQLVRRWLGRHRTPVAVAAVAVVALAITGGVAVRRVIAEQRVAKQNRADAEELMTFMLVDLRDKLAPIGKLELLGDVARKARAYYDQRPEDTTPEAHYKQAVARANLGHVLQDQGDSTNALAEYRAARDLVAALVAADADNATWRHELSNDQRRIGEVLEVHGDLPAALVEHRRALAIGRANVDAMESHLDIGRVLKAQGDSKGALAEYRAALPLAETPREMYLCHNYLAVELEVTGATTDAIAEYRAAQAIAAKRVAATPNDSEGQRDLYLTHIELGKILVAQADVTHGLPELRAAQTIAEALVARDGTNIVWQRDLSASDNEVGNVVFAQGDTANALVAFRAGQRVIQRLADQVPNNTDVARDVEVSNSRVGTVLEAQGDVAGALEQYRASLAIAERVATRDPSSAQMQLDVAMAHNDIGSALQTSGQLDAALAEFRSAQAIAQRLAARDPHDADAQRLLWALTSNIAEILVTKDPAAALVQARAATALAKALADRDPASVEARADYGTSRQKLAAVLDATHATALAQAEYRAALAMAEDLAKLDPTNAERQKQIAELRSKLRP